MKNLYEILIPIADNAGFVFSDSHRKLFFDMLIGETSGLSILPNLQGFWEEKGKIYEDINTPLRVICTGEDIKRFANTAKEHFDQLAILYYQISDNVVFYTGED